MLLSITEKCRMGCSHCLDNAQPDCDKFMTREMFEKAVDFNFQYDVAINITGGEPTEHPQFWSFMNILARKMTSYNACTITTNGMNLNDTDIDRIMELRKHCKGLFQWQVTSVDKYYPQKIDLSQNVFKLPGVTVVTSLASLAPMGRALQHPEWTFNRKAPHCFNLRSYARSTHDFAKTIALLRAGLKFCTPQISYDGSLKVGESTLCPEVAHITDSSQEIIRRIEGFKCANLECQKMLSKLAPQYRQAIGE